MISFTLCCLVASRFGRLVFLYRSLNLFFIQCDVGYVQLKCLMELMDDWVMEVVGPMGIWLSFCVTLSKQNYIVESSIGRSSGKKKKKKNPCTLGKHNTSYNYIRYIFQSGSTILLNNFHVMSVIEYNQYYGLQLGNTIAYIFRSLTGPSVQKTYSVVYSVVLICAVSNCRSVIGR